MSTGFPAPTTLSTATTSTPATTTVPSGGGVATPSPVQAGIPSNCNAFHFVVSGDGCAAIASAAQISLTDLYKWNPGVGSTCSTLYLGYYVCIGVAGVTPTATTTTSTTSSSNAVATPTPYQPGMATNCGKFHLVVSGDGCYAIATAAGIALADFYTWNPAVGSTCATLFLSYYVCIGLH